MLQNGLLHTWHTCLFGLAELLGTDKLRIQLLHCANTISFSPIKLSLVDPDVAFRPSPCSRTTKSRKYKPIKLAPVAFGVVERSIYAKNGGSSGE